MLIIKEMTTHLVTQTQIAGEEQSLRLPWLTVANTTLLPWEIKGTVIMILILCPQKD